MAALHSALKALAPTAFSAVPVSVPDATNYLQDLFQQAQLIVESVPPPSEDIGHAHAHARPRSNTAASVASNASEISSSSYRSSPPSPEAAALQKEWGKAIKLNAKDNPLNMSVYKLGGKDGRGAWFARRSVHEGMGFAKWKKGLEMEFPETLEVQGGPGVGNIRGIGGERRVERRIVKGTGKVEVYHLSAQFPGPTTPRDFVTLLITSTHAMKDGGANPLGPRHYMIVSKPCHHPECPPRDGFIRGQYESVEFIREVPVKPRKSSSSADLRSASRGRAHSPGVGKAAMLRNAEQKSHSFPLHHDNKSEGDLSHADQPHLSIPEGSMSDGEARSPTRRRGKTLSYAESRGREAKGEDIDNPHTETDEAEINPVEWIMITRSDPGGSVPRFMVERGTPGSIVADAVKFLDWACQKEHPDIDEEDETADGDGVDQIQGKKSREVSRPRLHFHDYETNGHLAGINDQETVENIEERKAAPITDSIHQNHLNPSVPQSTESFPESMVHSGIFASVTSAVTHGLEMYAPQMVVDFLPGHHSNSHEQLLSEQTSLGEHSQHHHHHQPTAEQHGQRHQPAAVDNASVSSASSIRSFASADSHFSGDDVHDTDSKSPSSQSDLISSMTPHEKELHKLNLRKKTLDEKLAKIRERETKSPTSQTEKELSAIKRAEEKHAKEVQRQEEKYKKEVSKLQQRQEKETKRLEEKKKKAEEKDEKVRLTRERDEMKAELELLKKEKDLWQSQIKDLQRENTMLTVKLGRLSAGKDGGSGSDNELSASASTPALNNVAGALVGTTASAGTAPAAQGIAAENRPTSPQKKDFLKDLKDVGERVRGLTIESMGGSRSRSESLRRGKGSSSPEAERKEVDKESVAS